MPDPVRPVELGGHQPVNLKLNAHHASFYITRHLRNSSGGLVGVEPMPLVTYSLTHRPRARRPVRRDAHRRRREEGHHRRCLRLGVLAHDVATDATAQVGSDHLHDRIVPRELESRQRTPALTFDAAAIADLRAKNIYLERKTCSGANFVALHLSEARTRET